MAWRTLWLWLMDWWTNDVKLMLKSFTHFWEIWWSCSLIFSLILNTHTHIVSLIPQQSVPFHKEDYTSGTRGFPGMGHSHPVCRLCVNHSVVAIAGHCFTVTTNLIHPRQGYAEDRCEIWSSGVTKGEGHLSVFVLLLVSFVSVFLAWCVSRVILKEFI